MRKAKYFTCKVAVSTVKPRSTFTSRIFIFDKACPSVKACPTVALLAETYNRFHRGITIINEQNYSYI